MLENYRDLLFNSLKKQGTKVKNSAKIDGSYTIYLQNLF